MNIEWNKVTWYSKLLALIMFAALPFIGFYFGMQYQESLTNAQLEATQNPIVHIPAPQTTITCGPTEHSCPCATGNYCLFRGAMCLSPKSACPVKPVIK